MLKDFHAFDAAKLEGPIATELRLQAMLQEKIHIAHIAQNNYLGNIVVNHKDAAENTIKYFGPYYNESNTEEEFFKALRIKLKESNFDSSGYFEMKFIKTSETAVSVKVRFGGYSDTMGYPKMIIRMALNGILIDDKLEEQVYHGGIENVPFELLHFDWNLTDYQTGVIISDRYKPL